MAPNFATTSTTSVASNLNRIKYSHRRHVKKEARIEEIAERIRHMGQKRLCKCYKLRLWFFFCNINKLYFILFYIHRFQCLKCLLKCFTIFTVTFALHSSPNRRQKSSGNVFELWSMWDLQLCACEADFISRSFFNQLPSIHEMGNQMNIGLITD